MVRTARGVGNMEWSREGRGDTNFGPGCPTIRGLWRDPATAWTATASTPPRLHGGESLRLVGQRFRLRLRHNFAPGMRRTQ